MRTSFIASAIAILCATAACGGEEPMPQPPPQPSASETPPPPPPPASTTEAPPPPPAKPALADLIPATMKSFGEAMNGRDAAKVASLFATDATWTSYGAGGEVKGREAIQKDVQMWLDMSSDLKGAPKRIFMKGNVVVDEMVFAGTMTGDMMGMKASKKPFGSTDCMVITFNDDGQIASIRDYFDVPGMMAQLMGKKDAPPVAALPSGPAEMHFAKGSPDEDKLVDWVKGWNDSFNKDDAKVLASTFADDADGTFYFAGGKYLKGKKDIEPFGAQFLRAFPNAKFTVANAWGIDGYLIAERPMTGTFKAKLGPVPPSNKDVTLHFLDIIQTTTDGKIAHLWAHGNMAELGPPPAAAPAKPAAAPAAPKQPAAPKPAAPKQPAAPKAPAAPKKTK